MRHLGNVQTEQAASIFQDYMLTQDVQITIDQEDHQWAVWVHDEDQLDEAKTEFEQYKDDPGDKKYTAAANEAKRIRDLELNRRLELARKNINLRRRWEQPQLSQCPVTITFILISVFVAVVTTDFSVWYRLCNQPESLLKYLYFVPITPAGDGGFYYPRSAFQNFSSGEIWRFITPIFIHLNYLHIVFNMFWLRELGASVEYKRGKGFYILLVLVVAFFSNYGQFIDAGPRFGGMSGVLYGLFGYIWIKSRYDPKAGFYMPPNIVFWMIAWLLLCYTGAIGQVANTAHSLGLLTGVVISGARPLYHLLIKSDG